MYLWDDTVLLEFTESTAAPDSSQFIDGTDLWITTQSNESREISILKVKFNTSVKLESGYDKDVK